MCFSVFFFFQAEDGIRDGHVTGVQTCALPISHERQGQNIADFPHIKRWLDAIKARPAVERAYAKAKEINPNAGGIRTAEERAILFGQTAESIAKAAAAAR